MLRIIWNFIIIIILLTSCGYCIEAAYSFNESGQYPLMIGNVTEYNGSDIVTSAINSASLDAKTQSVESKTVDEIKKEINIKLNIGNEAVKDKGRSLTVESSGDRTIKQICSIYDYMVGNWSYIPDPRGIEDYQYSNKSLEYGKGKYSGQGDCDDFSILLASLIESIGGTSRIMLAYGPLGGHAYTEVFLGEAEGAESDVDRMMKWLRANYNISDINVHTNLDTKEVWLNLDWWRDPDTNIDLARHPGGPFFKATDQTPIPIRENIAKIPLKPLNDLPIVLFTVSPAEPDANETVTFNASSSRDIGIGGEIKRYLWNYGDGKTGEGKITRHVYSQGGTYQANLTVIDNDGARNGTTRVMAINALPTSIIDYMPKDLKSGDSISFSATKSWDKEDGKIFKCQWEFGDGDTSMRMSPSHTYQENGNYTVNLTIIDSDGAKNRSYSIIRINHPPLARLTFEPQMPNQEESIRFDGSGSSDPDGNIIEYEWDFGDGNNQTGPFAKHSYAMGGSFIATLVVKDGNNATNASSSKIRVNKRPNAIFSARPQEPLINEPVVIDALESDDSDGKIVNYAWNLNGRIYEGPIINTEFSRPGMVNISLIVTDENGSEGLYFEPLVVIEREWNFDKDLDGWNRTGIPITVHATGEADLTKQVFWFATSYNLDSTGIVTIDGCNEWKDKYSVGIEKNIRLSKKAKLLSVTALKGGHDGGIRFIIIDSEGENFIGNETLSGIDKKTFSYDISRWAGETILLQIKGFGYGTNTTDCAFPECCGEQIGIDKVEIT